MTPLPESERFRAIYCSTEPIASFAECCDHFCPDIEVVSRDSAISENLLNRGLVGGLIHAKWRNKRLVGSALLDPNLRFANLETWRTLLFLRASRRVMSVASDLKLTRLDRSALLGQHRRLTQEVARYVYELKDRRGNPKFHGIRYFSPLNDKWECWAIFDTRVRRLAGTDTQLIIQNTDSIVPDYPALLKAADQLRLAVEISDKALIFPC